MKPIARRLLGLGAVIAVATAAAAALIACNQFRPPQSARVADYSKPAAAPDDSSWQSYGGDPGHSRYSPIAQITPANVVHLRQAWIYRTGEPQRRGQWGRHGKVQATPIIVAGSLVFCTPFSRAIALDPATGAERWVYDPGLGAIARLNGVQNTSDPATMIGVAWTLPCRPHWPRRCGSPVR